MKSSQLPLIAIAGALLAVGCSGGQSLPYPVSGELPPVSPESVASLFASVGIGPDQMREVSDAVLSSVGNGYDEEYLLSDLLSSPGRGVGESSASGTRSGGTYALPIKDMIRTYLNSSFGTRAGDEDGVEAYLAALIESGLQIYWPECSSWDGKTLPVITFDPGTDAEVNTGWELFEDKSGKIAVREMLVEETTTLEKPVWVINSNDDSSYLTLAQLRKEDPDWGRGGAISSRSPEGKWPGVLVIKNFTMNRRYETWFRGASEFAFKCGSVKGFTASTEAELRLFEPTVTDFVISVRRKDLGVRQDLDVVLVSEFPEQLENFVFMIVEDDGGTRTTWKADATVKVESKSYGITIELPYHDRDDIVWRGSLSSTYFERYSGQTAHFAGLDVVFGIL